MITQPTRTWTSSRLGKGQFVVSNVISSKFSMKRAFFPAVTATNLLHCVSPNSFISFNLNKSYFSVGEMIDVSSPKMTVQFLFCVSEIQNHHPASNRLPLDCFSVRHSYFNEH